MVEFRESHADMSKWDQPAVSFSTVGLTGIARKTVAGCVERMSRLYEQGAD
jgi:hypothetical protein